MKGILLIIFAYLVGSIPTGVLTSKLLGGVDPREVGSKNIGATNVLRSQGKTAGVITLLGDMTKGLIPTLMAFYILKTPLWVSMVAVAAFLGHLYPLFLGFKGGKGVATAAGVSLAISPPVFLLSSLVFGGVVYKWRYVSLGSLTSAATLPLFLLIFTLSLIYPIAGLIIGGMVFYKHRENIDRLMKGKEKKLGKRV
ncbi:MAG: glycerol-3-phosphate 1-O-acyltransferase PlsY [Thermodesulfobacteriota bacterium]